jgi:hypothetical protein
MRAMLYYPFVQPPRDLVAQGVLYWDQIGSIVPREYDLPDHLRRLMGSALYHPVYLDDYFDEISVGAITAEVETLLERIPATELVIPDAPLSRQTRLYYGKLPGELEGRLFELGAIRDAGTAFQGPQGLLGALLALLARNVAAAEPDPTIGWVCHTNLADAQSIAFNAPDERGAPGWRLEMSAVFKVPVGDTDLDELLDFRGRYNDERVELLRAVDHFVAATGEPDVPDLIPRISEEIEHAVAQIDQAGRSRGIRFRKAATWGTVAAAAGAVVPASSALGLGTEAIATGVSGVLGAALTNATLTYVKPEAASPYNYLHRARMQFG